MAATNVETTGVAPGDGQAAGGAEEWPSEVRRRLIEWLSFPEDMNVELLHDRIVHKAMARGEHGAAQGAVFSQVFRLRGRPGGGGGWWLTLEVDLYIGGEGVRPDVTGWRADKHPAPPPRVNLNEHLGVVVAPPDWVCEVLSTSTAARDKGTKRKAYQRAGVEWYWLVDLLSEEVHVFHRTQRSYELVETAYGGDVLRLPPFEEVEFEVAPLFEYKLARAGAAGQP